MSNVCKAWEYYGNCNSLRLKQPPSSYHIGKDAHHRESGNFCGHRNVSVPRRQHPNPNTLRDAPTVRRGKTRAQKCVNDSCIIPQPHTRGCPMSVKLGCCDKIKPQLSTILLNHMGLKCFNSMNSPCFLPFEISHDNLFAVLDVDSLLRLFDASAIQVKWFFIIFFNLPNLL